MTAMIWLPVITSPPAPDNVELLIWRKRPAADSRWTHARHIAGDPPEIFVPTDSLTFAQIEATHYCLVTPPTSGI